MSAQLYVGKPQGAFLNSREGFLYILHDTSTPVSQNKITSLQLCHSEAEDRNKKPGSALHIHLYTTLIKMQLNYRYNF